ncbi:MAG: hypothetical protein HUU37_07225 [Bdellovibrionales bacterium]|nr:hypothetical protein [Bdellovibrionales bacterium]
MKVSLGLQDGVNVLRVEGPVDARNLNVLKAGITKLFRDGKNQILLQLEGTGKLESDVIREIAVLDLFARELSGRLALLCGDEELKKSIASFAKPPVVSLFSDQATALAYFKTASSAAAEEEEDPKDLKQKLQAKDKELEALRAQIKLVDAAETQKLRAANVELQGQVKELEEKLSRMLKERRIPADADAYMAKLAEFEATIKDLTGKIPVAAKK